MDVPLSPTPLSHYTGAPFNGFFQNNHDMSASSRSSFRQQKGIAILTVLVIAVLIVTLAAVIFVRQSRAVRQTDNYQALERAWQYVFTMEQYAGLQLQLDAQTNKFDALTDRWAYPMPMQTQTEDSGAVIRFSGKIDDLQARYNINNLLDNEGKIRSGEDTVVKELIRQAGLPEGFLDAIVDWMDKDTLPRGLEGAERDYYLGGAIPYQPADMPFTDLSELRLLRLETQEPALKQRGLQTLLPMLSVIPARTEWQNLLPIKINVHTASIAVLRACGLKNDQIRVLLENRQQKKHYDSVDAVIAALNFNTQNPADQSTITTLKQHLDVKSNFFRLTGEIQINRARVFVNSLLFREPNGKVHVIMRQFDRVNEVPPKNDNDVSTTPANSL